MGMPFARNTSRRLSRGRRAAGRRTGGRLAAGLSAVVGLALGSAALATTSASAAPARPATSAAAVPGCAAADLAVWVDQEAGSAALGTWYYPLEFTNTSGHACSIEGYPGVSATDAAGRQLGDAAARDAVYPGRTVVIPAGGTAHARFGWGAAEVSTSGCKPETAAELKVYPPGSATARFTFFDLAACTIGGSHVYLSASVIQPGTHD
jgi:Protein of unknown function (DUF4232)